MSDFNIDDIESFLNKPNTTPLEDESPSEVSNPKKVEKVVSRPSNEIKKVYKDPGSKIKMKVERNEKREIVNMYISQSLIKEFLYKGEDIEFCPQFVKEVMITGEQKILSTESQLKGLYFETLCLGETSNSNMINDLPRKKNGEKKIDQIRIEEQAMLFPQILKSHGMEVLSKHGKKIGQFESSFPFNVFVTGEYDFRSPIIFNNIEIPVAIIDLKLTKDLDSDFGPYAWGNPKAMDHIQGDIYSWLWNAPFFYLVADYKANDRRWEIIPVNTLKFQDAIGHDEYYNDAKQRREDTRESIRKTVRLIIDFYFNGWTRIRNTKQCQKCHYSIMNYKNSNKELCEKSIIRV